MERDLAERCPSFRCIIGRRPCGIAIDRATRYEYRERVTFLKHGLPARPSESGLFRFDCEPVGQRRGRAPRRAAPAALRAGDSRSRLTLGTKGAAPRKKEVIVTVR